MSESNPEIDYKNLYRANLPLGVTFSPINSNYYYNGQRFNNITPVEFYRNYLFATMGFTASPLALFANSEAGVWYDPSQAANLDWRRNLLTFTEQFDNAAWTKLRSTVTANSTTSPDGTSNADTLLDTAVAGTHVAIQLITKAASAIAYTSSVYLKKSTLDQGELRMSDQAGNGIRCTFNLTTGAAGAAAAFGVGFVAGSSQITDTGNGWYRVAISGTTNAAATLGIEVYVANASGNISYTGTGAGFFIWGAQLEQGSTATEYQRITDVNTEVMERFPEATLFQDTAGTTPVTTAGQTVGLMLDKSKGLVLGSERLVNGDFSSGSTGWSVDGQDATHIATFSSGTLRYQSDTTSPLLVVQQLGVLVIGRTYLVEVTTSSWTSGSVKSDNFGAAIVLSSGVGTTRFRVVASSTTFQITRNSANVDLTIDNISVKELAGNHATQATAASRPTYGIVPFGGRRNLLTFTEQFDNAAWTKTRSTISANNTTAPDGSLTADKLVEDTTAGSNHFVASLGQNIGAGGVFTIYAKASERSRIGVRESTTTGAYAAFNLLSGTVLDSGSGASNVTISDAGGGWYRLQMAYSTSSNVNFAVFILTDSYTSGNPNAFTYTGDGTSGIYIWGAQLEAGSTATAYQRVTTQYDVKEAGVPPVAYLAFDGVDDGMVTPTITPSIDKVQVFAGLRKLSDAVTGVPFELGNTNNGGAVIFAPFGTANNYSFRSRGTISVDVAGSGYVAPITNVLTGLGDISGDLATLRVDGTQAATSTADQGTGNYLAYPIYIGRRGGTTFPFNGQLYSLITRFGGNLSNNAITSIETYVASKTGVTL